MSVDVSFTVGYGFVLPDTDEVVLRIGRLLFPHVVWSDEDLLFDIRDSESFSEIVDRLLGLPDFRGLTYANVGSYYSHEEPQLMVFTGESATTIHGDQMPKVVTMKSETGSTTKLRGFAAATLGDYWTELGWIGGVLWS